MRTTAYTKSNPSEQPEVVATSGQILSRNSGIELIGTTNSNNPQLMLWQHGCQPIIAPQVRYKRKTFVPITAHASL